MIVVLSSTPSREVSLMTVTFPDLGSPASVANLFLNIFNLVAIFYLMTHITLKNSKRRKVNKRDDTD